jgi:hypothetical protein
MGKATFPAMAIVLASALSHVAFAGTYVESAVSDPLKTTATSQTTKMWFDGGRFRLEMRNGQQVQIFKDRTIYALTVPTKRYTKIDQATLDGATKKAEEATNKLYDLLPPEQRAKMKKQRNTPPPMDRAVKPTNRTESAAGLSCKIWEVFMSGSKVRELCVAELAAIPNGKDLLRTMQQVSDAFKSSAAGATESRSDLETMNGVPIITRMYVSGKLFQESKATAIRSALTPDSLFTVPAGFQEQAMGEIG